MFVLGIFFVLATATTACWTHRGLPSWSVSRFKHLVTFGDSYTDESRLEYFINHGGVGPPPGTILAESSLIRPWARYVAQYADSLSLHNYAVAGAVCSNEITPRHFATIASDFPSVLEYEIPAWLAEHSLSPTGNGRTFYDLGTDTVFAILIGTNDLGNAAFLTDSQVSGSLLHDYTECVYRAFDAMYAAGGRSFILMNTVPLHLAPQYAVDGAPATRYYPDKPSNLTQIAARIQRDAASVNEIFRYKTPYELLIAQRYPGSDFALFDTWRMFTDIHNNPRLYLNGTAEPTVSDWSHHCSVAGANCVHRHNNTSPDSFMWWDELHPSEQVHRVLAGEIVTLLNGSSGMRSQPRPLSSENRVAPPTLNRTPATPGGHDPEHGPVE
ncbi:hypothetical protein PV11_04121 [Exophiala sideris]|uniref:SGNH hydrolase-type esterase domain-containing protein n=1 Tax=Exophiala sideris TaxID=1016849 RepID=A0A0D1VZX7_9EURO|nr:hypothetical protein PV11_04121 [Exophiala sideris]